jgi:transposase
MALFYLIYNIKGVSIMTSYSLFVGIDIAAKSAAAEWQHSESDLMQQMDIEQSKRDYKRLTQKLTKLCHPSQTFVVMEATGTYWMTLALYLYQVGFVVSVINPSQGRDFARAYLKRTKTDAVDAHMLTEFARAIHTEPWTPPPAICEQLQQRLARRDDFIHMKTQENNRLHALRHNPAAELSIIKSIKDNICHIQKQIAALTNEIKELLKSDHDWQASAKRLLTIKGIGIISAAWILVATHNFARCDNPEQAASFAGLAPHAQDSGSSVRGRRSVGSGGHAALRKTLYMAAGSACRFNPPIQRFYDRLVKQGKIKKVARCAATRKLLHIAWAVVVKEQDFDPNYQPIREPLQIAA